MDSRARDNVDPNAEIAAAGDSLFADHVRSVLVVAGNFEDAALMHKLVETGPATADFEIIHVGAVYEARSLLSFRTVGCILLDVDVPDADVLEAVEQLRDAAPGVPIIVLTSEPDDARAVMTVRRGAQDYLVRGSVDADLLGRCIRYAMERKRLERQIAFQALHDPLTGLPGRPLFMEYVRSALARARRNRSLVAVLYLDLDGFRAINDVHGHEVGDLVLNAVARRVQDAVRPGDGVARAGGDEFALVCESLAFESDAAVIARRVGAALTTTLALAPGPVVVAASIGVAIGAADDDPALLLRRAYAALHEAKRQRGGFAVYQEETPSESAAAIKV